MNTSVRRPTAGANPTSPAVPATAAPTSAAAGGKASAQQPAVGLVNADPPVVPPSTPAEGTHTLPVRSDGRWYCVTVGRQVGVFQGPYVLFITIHLRLLIVTSLAKM
jgi:hypothetical protein